MSNLLPRLSPFSWMNWLTENCIDKWKPRKEIKTNDNLWLHLPQLSTTPYLVVRQTLLNVEPSTCLGSPLPPMAFASIESMSATDMMIAAIIRTKTTTTAVGQVVVECWPMLCPCYVYSQIENGLTETDHAYDAMALECSPKDLFNIHIHRY